MPTPADFALPVINPKPKRPYGPGNPPPKQKGQVAKITRDIKQGVITAAENLGRDGAGADGFIGYCEFLGWHHPKAFAHLLGKMLPLQVTSDRPATPGISISVVSVDHGDFLCTEDIEKLRMQGTIEHAEIELRPEPAPPQTSAPIAEAASPSEEAIIEDLKTQINELSRKLGVGLVV